MTDTLHTHADIEIDRRPETVWAVVADYERDRTWRKGILEMTPDLPGDPQVGTHVREVLKLAGREYTTETEVLEVGPGMRYRFAGTGTSGAVRGLRSVRVGSTPESAIFTYDVELVPEAIPRVARPLLTWWLQHSMRRDLARLRRIVESS